MLVWIDLETTGLDVQRDELLEAAMVITDDDLRPIAQGSKVRHWNENFQGKALIDFIGADFVVEMHTKNGLIAECYGPDTNTADYMDSSFLAMMQTFGV